VTVALVTPFKDGAIDFPGLRRLVDWHVEQGTDCLAPVGTTGESPTLDHDEHERVIGAVVEQAAGRIKVMAGTGSNSTREAIRLTRFAHKAGADGALMVGPYYNKPTQEGYYRHFAAVAEAVPDLPIVLYNIPGRTGSNILPETIARLAQLPSIVAVKEATGSMDQASQIAALCDLTILSGDDSLTLPLMSIGGRGVVSVVGNLVPRDLKAMVTAFAAGNFAEALRWHRKLFPLCRDLLSVATNPIPVKTAMKLLGRGNGEMRLPMCPLDSAGEGRIAQTLREYGLSA
jgi:4-hydroxy-tetrahydrodipicolinate synthase